MRKCEIGEQVHRPGLVLVGFFVEMLRSYRPELALSEEMWKTAEWSIAGQWRQPPSFHRERKCSGGLVWPRSDGGFAGI